MTVNSNDFGNSNNSSKGSLSSDQRNHVLEAIKKAGEYALQYWPSSSDPLSYSVTIKSDGSPVTSVDIAVNEMLIAEILKVFPDDAFYTEESEPIGDFNNADGVWVIDPIDGTYYFTEGKPDFGVLVARVQNGVVTFGAAFFPALGIFIWAEKGIGAFYNDLKLKVSETSKLVADSIYVRNGKIRDKNIQYKEELSTAHGLLHFLKGEVNGFVVYINQHQEWDIAPWVIIVEESGGIITDREGNNILFKFCKPEYSALVASSHLIQDKLLSLLY